MLYFLVRGAALTQDGDVNGTGVVWVHTEGDGEVGEDAPGRTLDDEGGDLIDLCSSKSVLSGNNTHPMGSEHTRFQRRGVHLAEPSGEKSRTDRMDHFYKKSEVTFQ